MELIAARDGRLGVLKVGLVLVHDGGDEVVVLGRGRVGGVMEF